jgi:hypothetical protein
LKELEATQAHCWTTPMWGISNRRYSTLKAHYLKTNYRRIKPEPDSDRIRPRGMTKEGFCVALLRAEYSSSDSENGSSSSTNKILKIH